MMNNLEQLKNLWTKLTTLGAEHAALTPLRKRIVLTNKFSLTLAVMAGIYVFAWMIAGDWRLVLFNAFAFCLYSLILWLNRNGYFHVTRFLLLGSINLFVFFIVGGIGKLGETQVSFYVLAGISFIFFELRERIKIIIAILIPMILFGVLVHYDFKLFEFMLPNQVVVSPLATYYLNFAVIVLSMLYLSRETQRAEAQLIDTNEKLQSSQIFLRSIIENLPLAFYTRDMENRYTLVNSEFEKLFHVKGNEVLFKTDSELFSKSTVDFLVLFDKEVLKGRSSKIFEASISLNHDQHERTYLCTKFPVLGPHKETFGVCGIALDISDRIEAQKRLDEQRALVADNIRLSALTDMADGMSHEINNPLAAITLIQGKLVRLLNSGPVPDEVLRESLEKIQQSAKRITDIIAALRKFIGKSKSGSATYFNIAELIQDTLDLNDEKFKQGGIKLSVESTGVPFPILGQVEEIRYVISGLLANAYDAVEKNPHPEVKIISNFLDDRLKIIVQDSGSGVPKELITKLFQPFFTTKEVGRGQGLGLSISKGIVKAHGGELYYDNDEGLSKFVIELPHNRQASSADGHED